MNINEYLQKHQPVIYSSFCNAIKYNRLSHAYLISGNQGTPLLETAICFAKTLLCDDPTPLACNNCLTCMRVDDGNYADFILIDGRKGLIKKDDVQTIIDTFEKKALEVKGRQIYIIHLVENMNSESVNSLLKFLEEPGKEIYAFLTTENELKVLPTIISRTQKLVLRPVNQHEIVKESKIAGLASDDAEILSFFYSDVSLITKASQDENYQVAKECAFSTLEELSKKPRDAAYYIQSNVINTMKSKEEVRFYLDILTIMFEELLKVSKNSSIVLESYDRILRKLSSMYINIEDILLEIMVTRGRIDLNITLSLILDHIAYTLLKIKGVDDK